LSKIIKLLGLLNLLRSSSPPMLVYLRVLLPRSILSQIKCTIANSIKIPWIKKTRKKATISYDIENTRPIAFYTISAGKYMTAFFVKNDVIYFKKHNIANGKIFPLYDYRKGGYSLLEINDHHTDHFSFTNGYVQTPNGDIYLLYNRKDSHHKEEIIGIYNFTKKRIIYEIEDTATLHISAPLYNSIGIIIRENAEENNIHIHILNLLNGDKHEVSYSVKDHLISLLNLIKEKHLGDKLQESILQSHIKLRPIRRSYMIDVTLDKVVFCNGTTINMNIICKIENEIPLLEVYNGLVIRCSLEGSEMTITYETGELCYLLIKPEYLKIDIPSEIIMREKYKIEMPTNLRDSCLYPVSDLLGDYVILKNGVQRLSSSTDDKDYLEKEDVRLNQVLRFGDVNIYEISQGGNTRFLARLMTKMSNKGHKISMYPVYNSQYEIHILNLNKLYEILDRQQYSGETKTQEYVDVTNYLIKVNAEPILKKSSLIIHKLFEDLEGHLHKHIIYFDRISGDIYLFLSVFTYDVATKEYIVYIPVYKCSLSNFGAGYRHILTLGPYKDRIYLIPPHKLLPIVAKDIAITGHNILLYWDFLPNLVDEIGKTSSIFIYKGVIKFNPKLYYIEIVDIIYNRKIVFADSEYSRIRISNIKQDSKVIIFLDMSGNKIVYKPFVLSTMELVRLFR
jgi:hypothetical protein